MALTPEQLDAALGSAKKVKPGYVGWATDQRREWGRAVEAEVRKQDTELIRQMLEALTSLGGCGTVIQWEDQWERCIAAITAARARLGDEPTKAQPAIHPATVAACIARLEQGGQSAAV